MRIKVTSHRGHHECTAEADVVKAVFDKLTGRTTKPLPDDIRTKLPDTFQELESLWRPGTAGYTAISTDANGELVGMREFFPDAAEVVFIAPIIGG